MVANDLVGVRGRFRMTYIPTGIEKYFVSFEVNCDRKMLFAGIFVED